MAASRFCVVLAAVLALLFVAGCTTTASDGRYQTGGGSGWGNFRAEAPGGTARPS
jgi:hypothetical protein